MRSASRVLMSAVLAVIAGLSLLTAAPASASYCHLFVKSFTPAGGFGFPLGVAINQSTEEVYVTDYYNGTVYAFEASGAPDPTHPQLLKAPPATGPFPMSNPYGIAVDNSAGPNAGDIYVAQAGGGEVDQFSPGGVRTSQAPNHRSQRRGQRDCSIGRASQRRQ